MKVLGIYGSPRPRGNTDRLLDEALTAAAAAGAELDRLRVRELKIAGCLECGGCNETGECVQVDDMTEIYDRLDAADAIIIATPIFFYSVPAQLKALIDRAQARWNRRRLAKIGDDRRSYDGGRGYLIAVGATRGKNLFEGLELTAKYFFDALDMSYAGGIFLREVDDRGAAEDRPGALDDAGELGRRVVAAG